jgi:hypothetical protein
VWYRLVRTNPLPMEFGAKEYFTEAEVEAYPIRSVRL